MSKVHEIITDNIIRAIETSGRLPWQQPWRSYASGPRSARNKSYRGINVFILSMTRLIEGYSSNFWLTYRQAEAMGGTVRKGEKGTNIIFWKWNETQDSDGETKRIPILRYYRVFSLDQTEGVNLTTAMKTEHDDIPTDTLPSIDDAEAIVSSYFARDGAPGLTESGDSAHYIPALDTINVPLAGLFGQSEAFYATLFHEMTHSTGHKSRLDRKAPDGFSHGSYGKEELVAEMGAAFLNAEAGIEGTLDNSTAYLSGWLQKIKAEPTLLISAASEAQKAVDYILEVKWENEDA